MNDFETQIEAFKNDPGIVDAAVRHCYSHDAKLLCWPNLSQYPQLNAKSQTPGETPNFTDDEKNERARLIEQLLENAAAMFSHSIAVSRGEKEGKPQDIPYPVDKRTDFLNGLYLLARCGDESAFLELTARDSTFCGHWLFKQSIAGWIIQAASEQNKRAKDILKKLHKAIAFPHTISSPGAHRKTTPKAYSRYIQQKTKQPDKPDTEIYESIARETLKDDGKEITDNKHVRMLAARIKKQFQRMPGFLYPPDVARYAIKEEATPGMNQRAEKGQWALLFDFLKKNYES